MTYCDEAVEALIINISPGSHLPARRVTYEPIYVPADARLPGDVDPGCSELGTISLDPTTMTLSGTGTGLYATEWRVTRASDNTVMASGTGSDAVFEFIGQYNERYQLEFR